MKIKINPFCNQNGGTKHKLLPDGTCAYCNEIIVKDLHDLWNKAKKLSNEAIKLYEELSYE